ncbi:MAG: zinc-binding dehydrogenase [Pseudomonadales bacterium]|jgi:threonine dehydrogenase-like Zn-dependent dehydrogenase
MKNSVLEVRDYPTPVAGEGEVLVKTLACGICGSDLHALKFGQQMVDTSVETGGSFSMDLSRDLVMGHEFCAEILDYGPGTQKTLKPGARVCSVPITFRGGQVSTVGYSNEVPGGYSENMVLFEAMLLEVPNGLSTDLAALTEPMAVGYHAVQMAKIDKTEIPLVIGCGPVGLAVISALKLQGIGPIIAADYSETRRGLAIKMGADIIINPADKSPYESWTELAAKNSDGNDMPMEPLTSNQTLRQGVFFECVGIPGVIEQLMVGAPRGGRIIVVGVCMQHDSFRPLIGINKELNLQFVLGYTPEEFAHTLHQISEGVMDLEPLITGRIGLDGVPAAFKDLADPEKHAKILVNPSL